MAALTIILMAAVSLGGPGTPGDTCADPIPVDEGATLFDTTSHSDSGYSLYSTCDLMGILARDIWFTYDSNSEGVVTLSTCDPQSFDTSVIVYQAIRAGCDELEYVTCSGDAAGDSACQPYHSVVEFPVTEACTYLIRVGGWQPDSFGTGTLTLSHNDQNIPNYCPTDVNEDETTGVKDILAIISQWGACAGCPEDVDEDGLVGVNDILLIIAAWGPCPLQGEWQVLINSPVAPYLHHDSIAVIGDTVWICNVSGEIWKSTDVGETWLQVADQPGTSFRTISFWDELHGGLAISARAAGLAPRPTSIRSTRPTTAALLGRRFHSAPSTATSRMASAGSNTPTRTPSTASGGMPERRTSSRPPMAGRRGSRGT